VFAVCTTYIQGTVIGTKLGREQKTRAEDAEFSALSYDIVMVNLALCDTTN
jgi:surface antigen